MFEYKENDSFFENTEEILPEARTLCAASAYEEKYYFNPVFNKLPESVQEELRIISVLFTEEIGGVFAIGFDDGGSLIFHTQARASDYSYDEIGAELMIRQIQKNREDLLHSLELYYRVFVLKEKLPNDRTAENS